MSRIAGAFAQPQSLPAGTLENMLACLPGREAQVTGSLGWTGFHTPQVASEGPFHLVIDGCIYNRAELGGGSEAELVFRLCRQHGFEQTLPLLNGDFSIALYDATTRTLWLARDRFGLKPLYYVQQPDYLAFASQPRALLTLPGVTAEPNRQFVALFAASHYRYFDNQPERSPYRDIAQLPAAHYLRVTPEGTEKRAYWRLTEQPDFTEAEAVLAERYRELLLDAVELRFKAASRPAFTLSGGMDSSSVLASAVQSSGRKQHAFSTVYSDKTYDESQEIRSMLDTTVEQWHPVHIDIPDVFELVRQMVALHDEPVATATWLSHYLLCQETARQGFGSLFGGLGGDELNAGEYEYFFFFFADLKQQKRPEQLEREIAHWVRYHDHPIFRKSAAVAEDGLQRLVDPTQPGLCLPDRARLTRYSRTLNPDYFDLPGFTPEMPHPFSSYLKNRTYQDIFLETAPCCLRAEDRQTAAYGLGNFLPFFDHRLAEFMFRIPSSLKSRDGVTKHLLRQAMKGILPEETRQRIKKTGWNAPAHIWFSDQGLEHVRDLVASQRFRQRGIYHLPEVERLLGEHQVIVSSGASRENHMMFLWQLVNLELWLQGLEESAPFSAK